MNIPPGVPLLIGHCRILIFDRCIKSHAAIYSEWFYACSIWKAISTIQRGNDENIAFYSSQHMTEVGARRRAPRCRCATTPMSLATVSGNRTKNCLPL